MIAPTHCRIYPHVRETGDESSRFCILRINRLEQFAKDKRTPSRISSNHQPLASLKRTSQCRFGQIFKRAENSLFVVYVSINIVLLEIEI